jgi:Holliday junction DNA helicase RuvB
VHRLDFYDEQAMRQVVRRAALILGVSIDEEGIAEIARRSRGTPRVANRLLRRVRDYATVRAGGHIDKVVAQEALAVLGIDECGLDELDRKVLRALVEKFGGGPVGLETVAASVSEEPDTIMDVCEPYLLQCGLIERTPRGRVATRLAYERLGLTPPAPSQPSLF